MRCSGCLVIEQAKQFSKKQPIRTPKLRFSETNQVAGFKTLCYKCLRFSVRVYVTQKCMIFLRNDTAQHRSEKRSKKGKSNTSRAVTPVKKKKTPKKV